MQAALLQETVTQTPYCVSKTRILVSLQIGFFIGLMLLSRTQLQRHFAAHEPGIDIAVDTSMKVHPNRLRSFAKHGRQPLAAYKLDSQRQGVLLEQSIARAAPLLGVASADGGGTSQGRVVGSLEEVFIRFNRMGIYTLSFAAVLDRLPDISRLQDALSSVQSDHDLLQCSIQPQGTGFAFVKILATAEVKVIDAKGLALDDILASEVSRSWEAQPNQLPYRVWLVSGMQREQSAALGVSMSHALLDGLSAAKLLTRIVRRYNAKGGVHMDGNVKARDSVPISPSADDLSNIGWSDGQDFRKMLVLARMFSTSLVKAMTTSGFALPRSFSIESEPESRRSRILLRVLPADLVASVRSRAREEDTSVTGALCGALTLAIAREWCGDRDDGRPCKVVIEQAVDLARRLMSESERPRQLGCFSWGFKTAQAITEPSESSDRLWQVARASRKELLDNIEGHDWVTNMEEMSLLLEYGWFGTIFGEDTRLGSGVMLDAGGRTASALLSNMGMIDTGGDPPDDDAINIDRLHLAEAQSRVGAGVMLHAATMAKSGEMCLTYSYAEPLLGEQDAQRLADLVEEGLRNAVKPPTQRTKSDALGPLK